ncbi:hypothetical protein D3C78_425800 [compost metagenome]
MKCLKPQHPLLTVLASALLACTSEAMAGSCFDIESTTQTLNFGASLANASLTIPADTPNGTVVYQDTLQGTSHHWLCRENARYGIFLDPKFGTPAQLATTLPLGKTGLSFRLWIASMSRYEFAAGSVPANPSYHIGAGDYRLEIVKTGELASQVKVDAGYLGSLQSDDLILKKLNLTNPIVLNAASCQTPSVPVAMGDDYQLHEFRDADAKPRTVRFDIALNQCQTGINKVTYSLKATTPVIDRAKGIVALNSGSSAIRETLLESLSLSTTHQTALSAPLSEDEIHLLLGKTPGKQWSIWLTERMRDFLKAKKLNLLYVSSGVDAQVWRLYNTAPVVGDFPKAMLNRLESLKRNNTSNLQEICLTHASDGPSQLYIHS